MSTVAEITQALCRSLSALELPARVYLYDSRARQEAHSDSDWDLLILTPGTLSLADRNRLRAAI